MYRIDWSPVYPVDPWILRCMSSGAAYPNGRKPDGSFLVGQHPRRFPSAERAAGYARKYGVPLDPIVHRTVPESVTQPQNGEQ